MAVTSTIVVTHGSESVQSIIDQFGQSSTTPRTGVRNLATFLEGLFAGAHHAKIAVAVENITAGAKASATITLTHANVSDGDTTTIGGIVLTAKTAGGNEAQWTIGADATADAVALAACINAHSVLGRLMSATSALGVVTVTMLVPGVIGTLVTLATSDATAFAFSPATKLGNVTSVAGAAFREWAMGV